MLTIKQLKPCNTGPQTLPQRKISGQQVTMKMSDDVFISSYKKKSPALTFKGINTALSSKIYKTAAEIKDLFAKDANSNGIIGELPPSWTENNLEKSKKETIKDIYAGLAITSQILIDPIRHIMRNYTEYYIDKEGDKIVIMDPEINLDAEYDMSLPIKKASIELTKVLKANNIIKQEENINLQLDKVDTIASLYTFKAGSEEFTLKVFHPFYKDDFSKINGKYIEANRAAFISKNCPDSNYVKFFCEDVNNNYMLLKNVTGETPPSETPFNANDYGLIECAHPLKRTGNFINDYGILIVNKNTILANNKIARDTYITIKNTPNEVRLDKFNELLNKRMPDKQDVLVGLALSIGMLDNPDKTKLFQTLIQMNDSGEIKEALASQLPFLEEKEIPTIINQLLDGANQGLIDSVMSKYQVCFDQD